MRDAHCPIDINCHDVFVFLFRCLSEIRRHRVRFANVVHCQQYHSSAGRRLRKRHVFTQDTYIQTTENGFKCI